MSKLNEIVEELYNYIDSHIKATKPQANSDFVEMTNDYIFDTSDCKQPVSHICRYDSYYNNDIEYSMFTISFVIPDNEFIIDDDDAFCNISESKICIVKPSPLSKKSNNMASLSNVSSMYYGDDGFADKSIIFVTEDEFDKYVYVRLEASDDDETNETCGYVKQVGVHTVGGIFDDVKLISHYEDELYALLKCCLDHIHYRKILEK